MIVYFAFMSLALISYLTPRLRDSKRWFWAYNVVLALFLCFGYMCGSDWRTYELFYNDIDFNHLFDNNHTEPGYYIYMLSWKVLGVSFWPYFIITKLFIFVIISYAIHKYASRFIYLTWFIFLPQAGFFIFIDNPMRNAIAAAIFLLGVRYIISRNFKMYLLFCVLASSFHVTALILPLLYFVLDREISTKAYIITFVIVFVFFGVPGLFEDTLVRVGGINPFILNKVTWYLLGDTPDSVGKAFSLGTLLQVVVYFFLLYCRGNIEKEKYGRLILNASLLFVIIFRIGIALAIFGRLQLYFVVFYCAGISCLIKAFKYRSQFVYLFFIVSYSSFIGYKNISMNGWKYVPYTNYIWYVLTGNTLSYDQRDDYNKKHTPYKDSINLYSNDN